MFALKFQKYHLKGLRGKIGSSSLAPDDLAVN